MTGQLNLRDNIILMVDEAHRTQEGDLVGWSGVLLKNRSVVVIMAYSDFKSYIQANYADLLHREISKFVNERYDDLGFHSLNVLSLCEQQVENIEVKSLRCSDAPGSLV